MIYNNLLIDWSYLFVNSSTEKHLICSRIMWNDIHIFAGIGDVSDVIRCFLTQTFKCISDGILWQLLDNK